VISRRLVVCHFLIVD
jgi:hypothetical protein